MGDIFIRIIKLSTPGVTVLDADGNYNVYINEDLSEEERRKVADHELEHIKRDHFYSDKSVAECEKEADHQPVCRVSGNGCKVENNI